MGRCLRLLVRVGAGYFDFLVFCTFLGKRGKVASEWQGKVREDERSELMTEC